MTFYQYTISNFKSIKPWRAWLPTGSFYRKFLFQQLFLLFSVCANALFGHFSLIELSDFLIGNKTQHYISSGCETFVIIFENWAKNAEKRCHINVDPQRPFAAQTGFQAPALDSSQYFDSLYSPYTFPATLDGSYSLPVQPITDQVSHMQLDSKPKFAAVIENDLSSQFEMANGLKNYATVNTAEPVDVQLPFNIGTENVDKQDTLINEPPAGLEENSLITEFENAGINLYDFGESFGQGAFPLGDDSPNVKILSVKAIVPNHPQPVKEKGLQVNLATQEEISSAWGVSNFSNVGQFDVFQERLNENPLTAISTAVQSYLNLPALQPNAAPIAVVEGIENVDRYLASLNSRPKSDALKTLTSEAEICTCDNCKCNDNANCQSCNPAPPEEIASSTAATTNCSNAASNSCTCQDESGCGENMFKQALLGVVQQNAGCKEKGEQCCVVLCLKTLDQLRQMLKFATNCNGFQNFSLGCLKNPPPDLCQ